MLRTIVETVVLDVALPLVVYVALAAVGVAPVWALAYAAGVSVAVLAVRWMRNHEVSTLGVLVLMRFTVGIAVAAVTGDARIVLVKDVVITLGIAVFAAMSLVFDRPFIARIRRDLSGDRNAFDRRWASSPTFRAEHQRLTGIWTAALVAEVVISIGVISTAPLTAAVIITRVLTPTILLALIAIAHVRGQRADGSATALLHDAPRPE